MSDTARPRISVINADFLGLMSAIVDEDAGYYVTVFSAESTDEVIGPVERLVGRGQPVAG